MCRIIPNKKNNQFNNNNSKTIEIDDNLYLLFYIPETKNILDFINSMHIEDSHKGITSLRQYIINHNYYFEGFTFLTQYIVKNCTSCAGKIKQN